MRQPVKPTFISTAAMTMTWNGKSYDIKIGENTFDDIIIYEGTNSFTFSGTGTVGVEFVGGSF